MMEWLGPTLLATDTDQMLPSVEQDVVAQCQACCCCCQLECANPVGIACCSRAVVACIGIVAALQAPMDVSVGMSGSRM